MKTPTDKAIIERDILKQELQVHFDAAVSVGELSNTDTKYICDLATDVAERCFAVRQAAALRAIAPPQVPEGAPLTDQEVSNWRDTSHCNPCLHVRFKLLYQHVDWQTARLAETEKERDEAREVWNRSEEHCAHKHVERFELVTAKAIRDAEIVALRKLLNEILPWIQERCAEIETPGMSETAADRIAEHAKLPEIYGALARTAESYAGLTVLPKTEVEELRKDQARLEAVRLAALKEIAVHVGSIPESHIENRRLEHAYVLAAHRILATGEPDGVCSKTDAAMSSAQPEGERKVSVHDPKWCGNCQQFITPWHDCERHKPRPSVAAVPAMAELAKPTPAAADGKGET